MEKLATAIKNGDIMLFAGAGVSMNLGLPSLEALIDHIAKELEYDPDVYRTRGDFYALAEYYRIKKGSVAHYGVGWISNGIPVTFRLNTQRSINSFAPYNFLSFTRQTMIDGLNELLSATEKIISK